MSFLLQQPQKITVGDISDGPPANPADGDIWIATGVDANGTRWSFQYDAGSSSSYKWEFIGGAPLSVFHDGGPAVVNTFTLVATGWYIDPDGMSYTVVRAGDYTVWGSIAILPNGASGDCNVAAFNDTTPVFGQGIDLRDVTTQTVGYGPFTVTGVAAGKKVGIAIAPPTPGTNKLSDNSIAVIPRRIS